MTDLDCQTQEYYRQIEAEVAKETLAQDPVYRRFRYVSFVSRSKGRGRRRRHWKEVELVLDTGNSSCRCRTLNMFDSLVKSLCRSN